MDSNRNRASSIRGFSSAAEELSDDKCAICYLELREPLVQTTCEHRFCGDCMMRYDFEWANCIIDAKLLCSVNHKASISQSVSTFSFISIGYLFIDMSSSTLSKNAGNRPREKTMQTIIVADRSVSFNSAFEFLLILHNVWLVMILSTDW